MSLTVLLGGARSGKSRLALRLAESSGRPVTFIATAEALDAEMADRIARHRAERPDGWSTREEPRDLEGALRAVPDGTTIIVDCLTLWVSNLLEDGCSDAEVLERARSAAGVARDRAGVVIAVTNEVGSGVVPMTALGRRFQDLLGEVNAAWGDVADRAGLMVAGRVLWLPQPMGDGSADV
jgi:adenosylcobinamide kinase / adenosylcobinamide-phosphate guanylyltransferase